MEVQKEAMEILDLMTNPGFAVKENQIITVNQAASAMMIAPDTDVRTLLHTGTQEYAEFNGGCLYLKLKLNQTEVGATVIRTEDADLFLPDPAYASRELQAMALASVQLREPLTSAMSSMSQLLSAAGEGEKEQLQRLNRALYQMHRMISNMSDADERMNRPLLEVRNMRNLLAEIFARAQASLEKSGITLSFQGLEEEIYTLADAQLLERAVLNMLSNAVKFSPRGSVVRANVKRQGRMLLLSVLDEGSGISQKIQSSLFTRYLRQPVPEEASFGLGLGMKLIHSAATAHGGTVLIDHPDGIGTRVTLSIAIRSASEATLRSPVLRVDYAGERDHILVELADILSPDFY